MSRLLLALATLTLLACGGGGGGGGGGDTSEPGPGGGNSGIPPGGVSPPVTPPGGDPNFTPVSATLTWSIPTLRENGDPLLANELAGYEVYYFRQDDNWSPDCCVIIVNDPYATSTTVQITSAGTYYFAISAFDTSSLYSRTSDPVSAHFD